MLLAFFGFGGAARLGVRFEIVGCPFTFEFGNKGWNVELYQVATIIEDLNPTTRGEEKLGCRNWDALPNCTIPQMLLHSVWLDHDQQMDLTHLFQAPRLFLQWTQCHHMVKIHDEVVCNTHHHLDSWNLMNVVD